MATPHRPAPDYLVRAALTWARNTGKLKPPLPALLVDLHAFDDELHGVFQGTRMRVRLIDGGRWLSIQLDYAPDFRATHDFLLPREFADQQVTA